MAEKKVRETRRFGLRMIRPGLWRHRSGQLIVQTDGWDGPRGGNRKLWEVAEETAEGLNVGDPLDGGATLREMAQLLDRKEG